MLKNYPYKPPQPYYDLTKQLKANDNRTSENNWSLNEVIKQINSRN